MKTIKKLSREQQKSISGGFTQFQIDTCGGEHYVCVMRGGGSTAWGCSLKPGGKCYDPML